MVLFCCVRCHAAECFADLKAMVIAAVSVTASAAVWANASSAPTSLAIAPQPDCVEAPLRTTVNLAT